MIGTPCRRPTLPAIFLSHGGYWSSDSLVLWTMWGVLRRGSSFPWRITFGTLLHYWLFWFAFPYLGELP